VAGDTGGRQGRPAPGRSGEERGQVGKGSDASVVPPATDIQELELARALARARDGVSEAFWTSTEILACGPSR